MTINKNASLLYNAGEQKFEFKYHKEPNKEDVLIIFETSVGIVAVNGKEKILDFIKALLQFALEARDI